MKTALFAALSLITVPAAAQTAANPTPGANAAAAATPAVPATRLSLDTPIETIAADPAGKVVLEANFPGLLAHPAYDQFRAMTLTQLAPYSQGAIADASLAKAGPALAAIK